MSLVLHLIFLLSCIHAYFVCIFFNCWFSMHAWDRYNIVNHSLWSELWISIKIRLRTLFDPFDFSTVGVGMFLLWGERCQKKKLQPKRSTIIQKPGLTPNHHQQMDWVWKVKDGDRSSSITAEVHWARLWAANITSLLTVETFLILQQDSPKCEEYVVHNWSKGPWRETTTATEWDPLFNMCWNKSFT